MPRVHVTHEQSYPPETLLSLKGLLEKFISGALDCPQEVDGRLTPEDIDVRFLAFSELDTMSFPLTIDVYAMNFPGRSNVQQRTEQVRDALRARGWHDFDIFIMLMPAGYASA